IFFNSRLSLGVVNLKPLFPGHVLILSRRKVPRFCDLTPEEAQDLWLSAHTVSKVIEREYKGESLTLVIQDGPAAGQTVPHVHIHILPRKKVCSPSLCGAFTPLSSC
ncbi:HIT-like domain-containing protein, partial [Blyttiomyces helicus]